MNVDHVPVLHLAEMHLARDPVLKSLDLIVVEFKDLSTIHTHDMIVMIIIKKLVDDLSLCIHEGFFQNVGVAKNLDAAINSSGANSWVLLFDSLDQTLSIQMPA